MSKHACPRCGADLEDTLRAGADIPLLFDDDGSVTVQDTYLEHWFSCDACGEYIDIEDTFDKVYFD